VKLNTRKTPKIDKSNGIVFARVTVTDTLSVPNKKRGRKIEGAKDRERERERERERVR